MAKQAPTLFLEEWLRSNSGSGSNISSSSSSSSARAIIQAWADLRDSLQNQSFRPNHLQSLKTLLNSQTSLYVADPQAKLLLSILSSTNISLPPESYPLFLRLLYIWVRKSSKPSSVQIDSAVQILLHLVSTQFDSNKNPLFFSSEIVLLLGAFSFVSSASEKSKTLCLELLCRLLEGKYRLISSSEQHIPNVLAGIGYALSSSGNVYFVRILDSLLGIWNRESGPHGSVSHGLMVLHLIEWVLSSFINSNSMERVDVFTIEVLETSNSHHASFATVMAAAGALRVSSRSPSNALKRLRISAEAKIETVARGLISGTGGFTTSNYNPENSLLLKCISLGLARSGSVSFRAPLLICLASSLLTEVFPLQPLYKRVLNYQHESLSQLGINEVKEHLNSAQFKEAGAITGVFCNQYASADENTQSMVENLVWDYCQDAYSGHRQVALMLRGREDELLGFLEKIAESAFLMVVVFALAVTKHKLDSKFTHEMQMAISVKILVSFSCMEYFRRMRLPEYMDTIRAVVVTIQENESACVLFIESMPSYSDMTQPGFSSSQTMEYAWSKDEVQTSRILFYLRVIPTCIERLPAPIFRKVVAPIMFLYMGHPNGKVARASHSIFAAFVSSGKDSDEEERVLLKEQLIFYYIRRSLEGYPGITPFDGLASGVAALVRHLPAGSPSIFYTIHSLVEKAHGLYREVMTQDGDLWKNWQGELEPCKKIIDLLLRLLSLVDIQVLPSLMKQLAQLIVILPRDGQNMVLNDLYAQVAESDDVTRKPTLVSWLQSLSYLCSQASSGASKGVRRDENAVSIRTDDMLSLNRVNARL
ncbi:uncharacterized protein LOC130765910 [Actinidia eriantha]|uniref:uncharacterized protein LOC130765910 n=1 Tax=Actinidia eriantha TaxID=165200 RepID=UPI00258AD800|nr:uncharacterized protein LOC130765910 [Actinidia eriantha]